MSRDQRQEARNEDAVGTEGMTSRKKKHDGKNQPDLATGEKQSR